MKSNNSELNQHGQFVREKLKLDRNDISKAVVCTVPFHKFVFKT